MRTFTLDSSCIDAINEGRAEVKFIRALADAHTAGKAKVAVVALSVAEKHQFGSYFDDFDAFLTTGRSIWRLGSSTRLFRHLIPGWCIEPDDAMAALQKQIRYSISAIQFDWQDYADANDLDPDSLSPYGDWRRHKCTVWRCGPRHNGGRVCDR
jgi:hypothetical protein